MDETMAKSQALNTKQNQQIIFIDNCALIINHFLHCLVFGIWLLGIAL
jgi:hypothetical protein